MSNVGQERILIWGAGAIGGSIGAWLRRAGHNVTLVDSDAAHVAAIRDPDHGLVISGRPQDSFRIVMPAATPREVAFSGEPWDIVMLAVKSQFTRVASEAMLPYVADDGYVVSVQNGLCEAEIASVVGEARTIGCFVNFNGDRLGPGAIRFGQRAALVVGELDGQMTPRLERLRAILSDFEPDVIATDDIRSYLWGKLCLGAILTVTAVAKSPMVEVLDRRELTPLWRALCGEIVAAAFAEGVTPRGTDGFRPEAFFPDAPPNDAIASVAGVAAFLRPSTKTHSGSWNDLAIHRRKTEANTYLGAAVAVARRHGLASPALDHLLKVVAEIEDGSRDQSDSSPDELLAALG